MKTKDNLLKGIIIGIGVVIVPLILMGTTLSNTNYDPGNYQISTTGITEYSMYVYETIIDTRDGKVISRKKIRDSRYVK
jgi:hypothetical protein